MGVMRVTRSNKLIKYIVIGVFVGMLLIYLKFKKVNIEK
jgi:hypothetical protein